MQEFDYTMPFGDVHITCAMNEAEDAFYLYFTAFDDLQILEGVIEEGEPIVTFDRSGFMAGDAQNFLNQINPDAWVQRVTFRIKAAQKTKRGRRRYASPSFLIQIS